MYSHGWYTAVITSFLKLLQQLESFSQKRLTLHSFKAIRGTAGGIERNLLGWIRHLSTEETQRLETLADRVDVGHSHKHHLTVGIVFCNRRKTVITGSKNCF